MATTKKNKRLTPREMQKQRFRGWRNGEGLTIQAIADLLHAPVSTIIKWNDGAIPSRLYQRELVNVFGLGVNQWL